jgi:large subunit ribosomal protein L23
MSLKNPYQVVKSRYVTEKAKVLEGLKDAKSNRSLARCSKPKYVFLVDPRANKQQIKEAIEKLYQDKNITVVRVNTINQKPKEFGRKGKRQAGKSQLVKKAYVTLAEQNSIDD